MYTEIYIDIKTAINITHAIRRRPAPRRDLPREQHRPCGHSGGTIAIT